MAALIKHVLSKPFTTAVRYKTHYSRSSKKKIWLNPVKPMKKIESITSRIGARGFLRPLQDYSPPDDVVERCDQICKKAIGPHASNNTLIDDPQTRFTVLNDCFKEFKHSVPNSMLYSITTVGELKTFYETPVSTTTPLEKMKTIDLPENLHVQYEPIRFHPETDNLFGGQTAFPKSSTLVTGLRTRKKYKSYIIPDNYFKE